jgi:GntR family transcriptional regulator
MNTRAQSEDGAMPPRQPLSRITPGSAGSAMNGITLDPKGHTPLWRQLFAQVNALISNGAITQGTSLPPERDLAEVLGVSRATVKRCYDELRQGQRLAGRGRAGSVVQASHRGKSPLARLKGFNEEMRELGMESTTRMPVCEVVRNPAIASIFGRPSVASFLRLVRVHEGNGVAMSRELAWYDLALAPALVDWDGTDSAHDFLSETCHIELAYDEQSVEATLSTAEDMETFGFATPQPCLLFKHRTYTAHHQMVEYMESTFRGDAYIYRQKLTI